MKKTFIKIILFGISLIISIAILTDSIFTTYHYNQNLKNSFVLRKPDNTYARQEELTKDILLDLPRLFYSANVASSLALKMKLGTTLHYYDKPGDWIPERVTLKGTTIVAYLGEDSGNSDIYADFLNSYKWIYGFSFYPSYQRGWRVTLPLVTEHEYQKRIEPEWKLFYVRTSEVKKIENFLIKRGTVEKDWYLAIDKKLYEEGYYLSPDLYKSYFSFPVKCVICFWLFVIIFHLLLWKWKKGKIFFKNPPKFPFLLRLIECNDFIDGTCTDIIQNAFFCCFRK